MNKNYDEAVEFVKAVANKVPSSDKVETAICAPALYLRSLVEHQGENLRIVERLPPYAKYCHFSRITPGSMAVSGSPGSADASSTIWRGKLNAPKQIG